MFSYGYPGKGTISNSIWERTMSFDDIYERFFHIWREKGQKEGMMAGTSDWSKERADMMITQKKMIRWSVDRSWRHFWVKMNGVCLIQCQVHRWFTVFFPESLNFHIIFIWLMLLSAFDLFSGNNKHSIHFTRPLFRIMDGFLELMQLMSWHVGTFLYYHLQWLSVQKRSFQLLCINCLIVPG